MQDCLRRTIGVGQSPRRSPINAMWNRRIFLLLVATPLLAIDTDWITRLGGKVERTAAGGGVAVNLRGSWLSGVDMIALARLPDLERLDLSQTRITDAGILNLQPAPKPRDLRP